MQQRRSLTRAEFDVLAIFNAIKAFFALAA
jgi:hypothetical protein